MQRIYLIIAFCTILQPIFSQDTLQWVNQFGSFFNGGSGANDHEEIRGMVVDDSGNVYVGGKVYGPVYIEDSLFPHPVGNVSGFVTKFDSTGKLLWEKRVSSVLVNTLYKNPLGDGCLFSDGRKLFELSGAGDTTLLFTINSLIGGHRSMCVGNNGKIYALVNGLPGGFYAPQHPVGEDTTYLAVHANNGDLLEFKPIIKSISGGNPVPSGSVAIQRNSLGEIFIGGLNPYNNFHVIGGDTLNANAGNPMSYVIRLDSNGDFEWCKNSSSGELCAMRGFTMTQDEDLMFAYDHPNSSTHGMFGNYPMNKRPEIDDYRWMVLMDRDGTPKYIEETEYLAVGVGDALGKRVIDGALLPDHQMSVAQCNDTMFIPASSPVDNTAAFFEYDTVADGIKQVQYIHVEIPPSSTIFAEPSHIVLDQKGNIYMAGITPVSIHFQDSVYPFRGGDYDMFIAKWKYIPETPEEPDTCFAPGNFAVTDIWDSTAQLHWSSSPTAMAYHLEYGLSGFAQGSGTIITQPGTTALIENLLPETAYEAYLFAECEEGLLSDTLGPVAFVSDPTDTVNGIAPQVPGFVLSVRPVPASDVLFISASGSKGQRISSIEIFSTTGNVVYRKSRIAQSGLLEIISTAHWPTGVYAMHVKTSTGLVQVRKVTVVH